MAQYDWDDHNDRPTNRGNKRPTDLEHTVGQLMVESLNHRRRLEVVEDRITDLERSAKNNSTPPTSSSTPSAKHPLLILVRKTITTTAIIILGIIAAIKELGLLKP